jgi:hypothetical protein
VFGRFDPALGDTLIYTVNPDGSHEHQVLPVPSECPRWSGDGSRIVTCGFSDGRLLHEHPPFLIGRLRPDLLDIQLTEDAKNLVEAAGDMGPSSRRPDPRRGVRLKPSLACSRSA